MVMGKKAELIYLKAKLQTEIDRSADLAAKLEVVKKFLAERSVMDDREAQILLEEIDQ
jgi:hypothetical protein